MKTYYILLCGEVLSTNFLRKNAWEVNIMRPRLYENIFIIDSHLNDRLTNFRLIFLFRLKSEGMTSRFKYCYWEVWGHYDCWSFVSNLLFSLYILLEFSLCFWCSKMHFDVNPISTIDLSIKWAVSNYKLMPKDIFLIYLIYILPSSFHFHFWTLLVRIMDLLG